MKLFERIEDALQKCNQYNWAKKLQHFETHFVSDERNKAQIAWMNKQYKEKRDGFSLVQREIYLQEELSALTKLQTLTEDEKESIKRWQEELETFDERYWLHGRAFYKNIVDKPKGPWTRWWDMNSKDIFLYSQKSKLKCKARGGCCRYAKLCTYSEGIIVISHRPPDDRSYVVEISSFPPILIPCFVQFQRLHPNPPWSRILIGAIHILARNSPRVTIYNLYNGQDDEAEGYWWWLEEAIAPISEGSDSNERGTYSGDMDGLAENDLYDTLDDMADNTIR
ncbi:hypothetical protein V8E54_011668 [Elaphomyces granulatus]